MMAIGKGYVPINNMGMAEIKLLSNMRKLKAYSLH